MKIIKIVTKAFDTVYDLLEIMIKLGIVLVYLASRWIRHLILKTN